MQTSEGELGLLAHHFFNVTGHYPNSAFMFFSSVLRPSVPLSENLVMDERADQACERRGNVEIKPEFLAQLQEKADQRGLSLFAYLAHFVSQDNEDPRRKGPRFE